MTRTPSSDVSTSHRRRRGFVALKAAVAALALIVLTPSLALAHVEYRVEAGDSLSVIARRYGVSVADLAAENGISNLHLIRVGQILRVPAHAPTRYKVKPGDTLSEIARAAGTTTRQLVDLNRISNPNRIRAGQTLLLPAGSAAVATNPAAGYDRLPSRLRANPDRLNLIPSFEKWSAHYGVPADLLMAVAYRESGWQTGVISPKGAIGVGQIMPRTAEWIATDLIRVPELDPHNPDDNIRMSARFLSWLIGYMGSVDAAVAGYYQGPGSVTVRGYYDDTQAYIENIAQIRPLFVKS